MKKETIEDVLIHGIQATSILADYMMEMLPDETRQKVKLTRISLLKKVHEITGEMINKDENQEETDKSKPVKIIIE